MTIGVVCACCLVGYCAIVIFTVRAFHRLAVTRSHIAAQSDLSDEAIARVLSEWSR